MKRSTFFLIGILAGLVASLVSCTKPALERLEVPEQSKIEFTLYEDLKTYVEVNAAAQTVNGARVYSFVGTKNPAAENIFTLSFITDSLQPGSYSTNTGVVSFREGLKIVTNVSTNLTVNITSNVNGLVNGTFTGNLYDHQTGTTCEILSGKIENIQLVYR